MANPKTFISLCALVVVLYLTTLFLQSRLPVGAPTPAGPTVIVVPGGGLTAAGGLPAHSLERMNKAVELFHASEEAVVVTLSAGTTHKPNPTDADHFTHYESSVALKYLVDRGLPVQRVFEEKLSLDTIGNAYFLRTIHLDVKPTWNHLVVITNTWHMKRTQAIFEKVLSLPSAAKPAGAYASRFVAVPDALPADTLAARQEREAASLQSFLLNTQHQWSTLEELHTWLFTKHSAYAAVRVSRHHEKENISADISKTY